MKEPAQVGYEAFSDSFGIDIVQPNGKDRTVKGPIPWESLPAGTRARWRHVAHQIIEAQQALAIENARTVIESTRATQPIDAPDIRKEAELTEEVRTSLREGTTAHIPGVGDV